MFLIKLFELYMDNRFSVQFSTEGHRAQLQARLIYLSNIIKY